MNPTKIVAPLAGTPWVAMLLVGLAAPFQPVAAGLVAIRPTLDIDEGQLPSPRPLHISASATTAAPSCSLKGAARGRIRALLIGLNRYQSTRLPVPKGSVNDVQLLKQLLLVRGGELVLFRVAAADHR